MYSRVTPYKQFLGPHLPAPRSSAVDSATPAPYSHPRHWPNNPITGNRDEVVISASWGLGESIIGGAVTPDTFVVRKSDLAIINRAIADKQRMAIPIPGGTREVDVPRFLRGQSPLADEQTMEMACLALTLETTMGHPVDVECAYTKNELYLLQCLSVTTL